MQCEACIALALLKTPNRDRPIVSNRLILADTYTDISVSAKNLLIGIGIMKDQLIGIGIGWICCQLIG